MFFELACENVFTTILDEANPLLQDPDDKVDFQAEEFDPFGAGLEQPDGFGL